MNLFQVVSGLVSLAAVLAYLNHRLLKLPITIGLMLGALVISLAIIGLGKVGIHFEYVAKEVIGSINFDETVLQGMLSFLLFAGALHINLDDLSRQKWVILLLATFGVLASTFMVGYASWLVLGLLGVDIPLIYCLLFGALISPTDPIAVLAIIKTVGAPKDLETTIAGESLFNDGIAVVVFLTILNIAAGGHDIGFSQVAALFARETLGGIAFGLASGYVVFLMLRRIDNYQVEVLLTLALVMGGYALAGALHLSGPIATVVAGLLIGNHGRILGMSEKTRQNLDMFWELVDEILNAVLFVLIGLEILLIPMDPKLFWTGLAMIPTVLAARFLSVSIPITAMRFRRRFPRGVIPILTWTGLRGGISVALALSLPASASRDIIISITYIIVIFSILVQGLTCGKLIRAQSRK